MFQSEKLISFNVPVGVAATQAIKNKGIGQSEIYLLSSGEMPRGLSKWGSRLTAKRSPVKRFLLHILTSNVVRPQVYFEKSNIPLKVSAFLFIRHKLNLPVTISLE